MFREERTTIVTRNPSVTHTGKRFEHVSIGDISFVCLKYETGNQLFIPTERICSIFVSVEGGKK